jgi:uncharacterized protein (TIGR02646 family)
MKRIHKRPEPTELTEWKREWAGPDTSWSDLPGDVTQALRESLFNEQGHICCYCGRRIVPNDSHIEHLVPRSPETGDPTLTFVYENLLASCQANLMSGDPIHCGMKKGNWYDPVLLYFPPQPQLRSSASLRAGWPRHRRRRNRRRSHGDD